MKTLHLYLTRQVLATLVMTVVVFTFVLLIANALREIMDAIIKHQATIGGVVEAFGLLLPWVLVFALPLGMLTAALLVFGRFSADQELTAVRSSGISLAALVSPILVLSLALCCVSAWINMEVGPRCRVEYKHLLFEMGVKLGGLVVPEGRYVKDFPGIIYYVGKNDAGDLKDIFIEKLDENQYVKEEIRADRGRIDVTNDVVTVRLFDAHTFVLENGVISPGEQPELVLTNKLKLSNATESQSLTDMTMGQLLQELHDREQNFSVVDTRKLSRDELVRLKRLMEKQADDVTMPVRVQIHRELAFSFACFGFTLVGIPLGIRAHRRETNIGIVMALVLVLFYYSFIVLGQALSTHANCAPHLIVWVPNFIFQTVGVVMLWRANRGI